MRAPLPDNEDARLRALRSYQILDTPPEREFDDLTHLASIICNAPVAVVSLIDQDRQWFKSRVGLEATQTPRDDAFCAYTILDTKMMIVSAANRDERFADNPLVTGELGVRFYAGVPLVTPAGHALGALCVVDRVERTLTPLQQTALEALGRQAITQLELRRTFLTMQAAQAQIARSEEQLSLAVAAAGIGFWDWDMRANTVTMSELHEELLGLAPTGLPRPVHEFFERVHPDDLPRVQAEVERAIATHERYDTEMRVVWPDGTVHWMADAGSAQYDANGAPYRMNGTMAEITARKRTEHDLAVRQERFDLAVTAANTGVWEWSPTLGLWYVSPQSREILGYSQNDPPWPSGHWLTLVHADDLPQIMETVRTHLADPSLGTWQIEHRSQHRDGSWRWILAQARMVRSADGSVQRLVGTHIDMTEQKERERVLATAKATADEANRAKSDFLANMSHEIRTPMHGILGMSHLLAESQLSVEQREFLEGIEQSAQSLLTLVNDVLDFSKVEAGKMTLELADFDLAQLLRDLTKQYRVAAARKGLQLALELLLPEPAWFVGDAERLRQVLINLLGNAIKFTSEGGVLVRALRLGGSDACPMLRLEVIDTGIGIAPDATGQLFQPFSQLDSSRARRFEGTGLGLSICRRVAELMGGQMGVESRVGEGSVFWLEVALPTAEARAHKLGRSKSDSTVWAPRRSGRVLVVEDNTINQRIMLARLNKLGMDADVASNGREAIAAAERTVYDLVLMDCQMPEMDGYEATRQMRASALQQVARVPILAMTANAMPGERERCIAAGMSAYLAKPIDEKELVKTMDHWLMRRTHGTVHESDGVLLPVLDTAALDRLGGTDNAEGLELILELIVLFRTTTPNLLQTMQDNAAAGNWPQVAMAAHSLKSSAGYLGAARLSGKCQQLEALCAGGDEDAALILARVDAILTDHRDAVDALTELEASLQVGQAAAANGNSPSTSGD